MTYFHKGRHRPTRSSFTVAELIEELRRIPIAELFAMRDELWSRRANLSMVWAPCDFAEAAALAGQFPHEVIA